MNATVKEVRNDCVEIAWEPAEEAEKYHVYWADKDISTIHTPDIFRKISEDVVKVC